jgi:amino acid adenylation domain-containing protein
MYTSGSTGVPKGIMHTHSSGLAYATAAADLYGVRSDDRLSNHSPLHFDMSTFDYFAGPLAGATTIIVPESYSVLPASMSQLVQDEAMTIWYSVPLALIQILTRGVLDQRDLSTLRWVLFGGEPFPPRHLQDLMRRLPGARFSNVYGPAEVNQCTYYHVPPSYAAESNTTSVPLGQMWAAAEGIVVDSNDDVVAIGGTGELLVRTPTMMEGYWNRPDLDARAFYYRDQDGESVVRFYRTGDVVRLREDGLMDFIGRGDRQVKIRGYRVELDEVERAVVSHARVREAAAVAVDGPDGVKEIHVLILADSDDGPSDRELLTYLRSVLPPYALPARVVAVDAFPRTGSGKIDRTRIEADIRNTQQTAGARV